MTKKDLIASVHELLGDSAPGRKKIGEIVDAIFNQVGEALGSESARYSQPGFGTFTVKVRAARKGRNPRTGQEIDIAESRSVGFKPAPEFKRGLS